MLIGDTLDALLPVRRNNNAPDSITESRVQFQTKAGQTYQIAVGHNAGKGNVALNIQLELNAQPSSEVGT